MGGTVTQDQTSQLLFSVGAETWTVNRYVLVFSNVGPAAYSNQSQSKLVNHGSIHSVATAGVLLDTASTAATVNNSKTGVIRGWVDGIKIEGTGATINNKGGVVGTTQYGVAISFNARTAAVNNDGVIVGNRYGIFDYSNHDGGTIRNAGLIQSEGFAEDGASG